MFSKLNMLCFYFCTLDIHILPICYFDFGPFVRPICLVSNFFFIYIRAHPHMPFHIYKFRIYLLIRISRHQNFECPRFWYVCVHVNVLSVVHWSAQFSKCSITTTTTMMMVAIDDNSLLWSLHSKRMKRTYYGMHFRWNDNNLRPNRHKIVFIMAFIYADHSFD